MNGKDTVERTQSGQVGAWLTRCSRCIGMLAMLGLGLSGCVSSRTHEETLAELEKARHAAAQQAAEDEASLAEVRRENERLAARLEEIGKDKLSTQLLRDRLTITMVDRVLFESGSDRITPEGMEVLYKVSAVLRDARDKRILVSGHTDNVQIGPSLRARFKTNWELSTARATSVVRYLVDHANIAPESLTAVGHAYTKPVADNDSEQGRSQNRRIEIALYPKDVRGLAAIGPDR